jgi:hypothetical protein
MRERPVRILDLVELTANSAISSGVLRRVTIVDMWSRLRIDVSFPDRISTHVTVIHVKQSVRGTKPGISKEGALLSRGENGHLVHGHLIQPI